MNIYYIKQKNPLSVDLVHIKIYYENIIVVRMGANGVTII
jgi:hypothetical protein